MVASPVSLRWTLGPIALLVAGCASADSARGARNTDFAPAFEAQFRAPLVESEATVDTRVVTDALGVPWGIATLPDDGGFLVTEREGQLRHLLLDGTLSEPLAGVPEVHAQDQGGLLDVALSPDFADTRHVYLTYAKPLGDDLSATAAARARLSDDLSGLEGLEEIFVQSPPSPTAKHYGSRIVFDDAGHALITTGEHSSMKERVFSQQLETTYGKVIRVGLDGSIPGDNPFIGQSDADPAIWSYGHRNIQGAAVDANGTLWTIEHGPKGGDELNRPEAGANYGWPLVSYGERYSGSAIGTGDASAEGLEEPVYFWDPVIAPGGMDFHRGEQFADWNGDLLIGGLVAQAVVRLDIGDDGLVRGEEHVVPGIGRVRDVEVLDDGSFLVLVGRGGGKVVHVTEGG